MKLIRARLASSFEDSGIAPRLVPPVVEAKPEQPVQEQPAPPAAEAKVKSKVQTTPAQQAPVEVEPPQPVVKKEQQPAIAKPVVDGSAKQPASQETAAEQGALEPPLDWTDEGRPVWASGRFECLLFTVAGLKLAVPLIALGSIHPIEEHFTPLVGRANWFMGLMPVQGRRLRVVDTALWVMPEKYRTEIRDNYQYVIRLGRSNWGIACDKVAQAITLKADEVRWRTQRSKRPWLAGTVVEYMCALMDVETFEYMLAESDRTGKPMQF
ncbi:MAG: chemotaxis protein CheW [Hahellaceae bacterium]|nr:chemotaxis protein CheW [Hahellaceae bacterium]MCP5212697.1 chemotaxis protein CheW [Hahellaceae bacterium]